MTSYRPKDTPPGYKWKLVIDPFSGSERWILEPDPQYHSSVDKGILDQLTGI